MAGFNFGSFAQVLDDTKESGVSFEGKARNWGTEEEGLHFFLHNAFILVVITFN